MDQTKIVLLYQKFARQNFSQHTFFIDPVEKRLKRIHEHRAGAREGLQKQAKKMLKSASKKFGPATVGTTVKVQIPDVDKAKGALRNILGVVTNVENDFYKIGMNFKLVSNHLKNIYI